MYCYHLIPALQNAIINYSTEIRQDIASYVRPLTEEQMHPISTLGNTLLTTTLSDDADDVPDKANTGEQVVAHDHHHVLTCPHNELVTFWESPSLSDRRYKTPYEDNSRTKYVTFEPGI